ncbi:MAG: pilus assembly protein Flp/PilA [Gammaproteobacteria bacterium]
MNKIISATKRFLNEEKGTEIVEWAILGGLVVAVGAAVFVGIGTDTATALGKVATEVGTAAN